MLCVFLFKVCVGQKFLPWYICSFACTLYLVSVLLLIYFQNQLLEVMSWNSLCFFMHTHRYRHTHIHTFLPTFYISHSSHINSVKVDHQVTSRFFWQPSMKSSEVNYIICFRKELENNWLLYSSCLVPSFPSFSESF